MDISEIKRVNQIAQQNSTNSESYHQSRQRHAKIKFYLDVQLIKSYTDGDIPTSISYEKALIHIAALSDTNKKAYKDFLLEESNYKGLEKIIDANEGQISWAQSRLKYEERGS